MFHVSYHDCQFHTSQTKRFKLLFLIGELGMINIYENKKGLTYWPTVSKYISGFPNMVFYSCSLTNLFTILSPLWGNSNFLFHKVLTSFRKVPTLLWHIHAFGSLGSFIFYRYRLLLEIPTDLLILTVIFLSFYSFFKAASITFIFV